MTSARPLPPLVPPPAATTGAAAAHRPVARAVAWVRALALCAAAAVAAAAAPALAQPAPPLRIVGGLAGLNQFTRHEEPFWAQRLQELSAGRYRAEIVPFDRAGLRGQDLLSLVSAGSVPFGTVLLSLAVAEAELAAPDLPGLNPDMATLRATVAAFRPTLARLLRERRDVELLAVYTYPAQVLFCNRPLKVLDDLRGRRIRTSSRVQSDWVEALGAQAIVTSFAEIVPTMRAGNLDCAITGTMSGHSVGLDQITTHMHTMALNWGLSVFVAHGAAWRALPPDLRELLLRELPRLEAAVWDEADRETTLGVRCSTGSAACPGGRPGRMVALPPSPADLRRAREILGEAVLPRWVERCGPECAALWQRTLAATTGVAAPHR
jgi:TRAP-type C4-dicarboxylate transport system substrate-binding protein